MALKQLSRKINCPNLFYSQLTFYKPPQNMMSVLETTPKPKDVQDKNQIEKQSATLKNENLFPETKAIAKKGN